jgi:acylphosphatase
MLPVVDRSTVSFVVHGHVQGVGFRRYVEELAVRLGVRGKVWNTLSRTVEGVAQHESVSRLAEFIAGLRSGPGVVTEVETRQLMGAGKVEGFSVGYSRP